jgi:small subunit ribosomal protein S27Ae
LYRERVEELAGYTVDRLICGTAQLDEEMTLNECEIADEAHIEAACDLDAGKRKRKKKVYHTPKKIAHKHKKRPMAVLEYFQVDESGKIRRTKMESPYCKVGTYMADHQDRYVCGKTGHTIWRTTADGKRMPIPKQNKTAVVAAVKEVAKKKKKKGKK